MAKACPVILRNRLSIEILAFKHPLAGYQIVKGTVESYESIEQACVRELAEEAGIEASVDSKIGEIDIQSDIWYFMYMIPISTLPDAWSYYTEDDGGLLFDFFWHPLHLPPSSEWHANFKEALQFLQYNVQLKHY